jgi:lysozyme
MKAGANFPREEPEIMMRRARFGLALVAIVLVAAFILALPGAAEAQTGRRYVVQPGDTLFTIAARFGVSVSELATINGVYDVNRLFVGQVLTLPAPINPPAPTSVPVPVTRPQPIQRFPPGTVITTTTTITYYTVRQGDTLAKIAARFSTTVGAIMAANGLSNANYIFSGQVLAVPRTRTTVVPGRVTRATGRLYHVQPGDNLFGIAARFRRDVYAIARANGLLNLNQIYVGQALIIP